jgi:hypothetical protein
MRKNKIIFFWGYLGEGPEYRPCPSVIFDLFPRARKETKK